MVAISKSQLWAEMQKYYDSIGPELWQDEIVPNLITSNTHLASQYAQLILNFFLDAKQDTGKNDITIIELGVGHGRFSFYLLKKCLELTKNSEIEINFNYIITDISQKNLDLCKGHAALKPYITAGIVDFAKFNPLTDHELSLQKSSKTIKLQNVTAPVVFIANYIYDSLPHDAFEVHEHNLYEVGIELTKTGDMNLELFNNTKFNFNRNLVNSDYYTDPKLNKVLAYYLDTFEDASFLLPIGGINVLQSSKQIKAPVMHLVADKSVADLELFATRSDPDIGLHGSISMLVNFHALEMFVNDDNGISLMMPNTSAEFQVAAFCLNTQQCSHLKAAFQTSFGAATPQDIINLSYDDDGEIFHEQSVTKILSLLNFASWDPNIFYDYHTSILEYLEENEIDSEEETNLLYGLEQVWQYFYKLEPSVNIPFAIGSILYNLDLNEEAIIYLKKSLELYGEDKESLYNLALVYLELEQNAEAQDCISRLQHNHPNCDEIAELKSLA